MQLRPAGFRTGFSPAESSTGAVIGIIVRFLNIAAHCNRRRSTVCARFQGNAALPRR
jgi:hypothetical protein